MRIIIIVSDQEGLLRSYRWARLFDCGDDRVFYVSDSCFEINHPDLCVVNVHYCDNVNDALSKAANLVSKDHETVISKDSVVPVSGWREEINSARKKIPNLHSCFGRWYGEVLDNRSFIPNSQMGVKFKDFVPKIIAGSVVDFSPSAEVHSIEVDRFPIYFNWFSEELTPVLRSALEFSSSLNELSYFLENHMFMEKKSIGYYYLLGFSVVDECLL